MAVELAVHKPIQYERATNVPPCNHAVTLQSLQGGSPIQYERWLHKHRPCLCTNIELAPHATLCSNSTAGVSQYHIELAVAHVCVQ